MREHSVTYGIDVTAEEDNQIVRADVLNVVGGSNEIWNTETSTARSSSDISAAENLDDTQNEDSSGLNLAMVAASSKLAYDTGHGDFCFGRWCERNSPWSSHKREDQNLYEGSNGAAVTELDGSDRFVDRHLFFPFYRELTKCTGKEYFHFKNCLQN